MQAGKSHKVRAGEGRNQFDFPWLTKLETHEGNRTCKHGQDEGGVNHYCKLFAIAGQEIGPVAMASGPATYYFINSICRARLMERVSRRW